MLSVLGIKISDINQKKALEKVNFFLDSEKQFKIFTPNPEMVVAAQKDKYLREVINTGELNICDGKGIQLVLKNKVERITGVDFMLDVCKIASEKSKSVYLLGSKSRKVVQDCANNIKKKYPNISIVGMDEGLNILEYKQKLEIENNEEIIKKINNSKTDILFVAFGHSKQEKWIYQNLNKMPSVRIVMGVGGAFDFISGNVKRAPKWVRAVGMEWLFRLIRQPRRFLRIFRATFVFLYLYYRNSLR